MNNPLDPYRPPKAPPELRRRTLSAAREALAAAHKPPTVFTRWVDRVWENRGLRLTWAAMVLLLLAVNTLLSVLPPLHGTASGSALMAVTPAAPEDPLRGVVPPLGLASLQDRSPTWGGARNTLDVAGTLESFESLESFGPQEPLPSQEIF
jgi:hypothetical protein